MKTGKQLNTRSNLFDALLQSGTGKSSGFFQCGSVVTGTPTGAEDVDMIDIEAECLRFQAVGHRPVQHTDPFMNN